MKFWLGMGFVALGVCVLCSLGAWQVKRLHWKQGLIAQVEAYQQDDVALEGYVDDAQAAFRRGHIEGVWQGAGTFKTKPRLMDGAIGYWIVTPLELDDGRVVMVNRGWVQDGVEGQVLAAGVPVGPVHVRGVLREHGALADYAPVRDGGMWVLFMEASVPADHRELVPAPVQASLRNEHRNYAIFWFTMAAVLAGLGVFSLLRRRLV